MATRAALVRAGASPTPASPLSQRRRRASHTSSEGAAANPVTHDFEFVGPYVGPAGILVGLPLLVWTSAVYCTKDGWPMLPTAVPSLADIQATFSWTALAVYVAWWLFQATLYLVVPGTVAKGVLLRDGSRLAYRTNGWRCFLITLAAAAAVHLWVHPLTWIADNFVQLIAAAILFSFALSVYLYASSFVGHKLLALGGNSGIPLYDFFIGRELNPRVLGGQLDLKYFCELRPGLFLWVLIDAAMLLKQLQASGSVSLGMAIVVALQTLYVADSVFCEECILTTIDIIQDGFGFMLVFGDLAWVPAMYSLQARFLADAASPTSSSSSSGVALSAPYAALCLAVGVAGFYVFRAANAQKDTFKRDPNDASVKDLPCIKTATGSRLLAGGWWGLSRHVNYFGDWLLSVGMSLPTGFVTPLTYFYPVYFAVLLWHREMRDDHKCSAKYGEQWIEYKRRVPYRIIPGIY